MILYEKESKSETIYKYRGLCSLKGDILMCSASLILNVILAHRFVLNFNKRNLDDTMGTMWFNFSNKNMHLYVS